MTVEKLKKALSEPFIHLDGVSARDEALERRREACLQGDILAIYTALEWCYADAFGWPGVCLEYLEGRDRNNVQVPRWLIETVMKLVSGGIAGQWPRPKTRQSTAARQLHRRRMHLGRTLLILEARAEGHAWEGIFRYVARKIRKEKDRRVSARELENSYREVARVYKSKAGLKTYLFDPRFLVP